MTRVARKQVHSHGNVNITLSVADVPGMEMVASFCQMQRAVRQ